MSMPIVDETFSPPSLKDKLKSSFCCFGSTYDSLRHEQLEPRSSPYTWQKSTEQELELKDRCLILIGRKDNQRPHHQRRRHKSTDFRYDPESYSLNFEDEDSLPLNSFTARLPATPERLPTAAPPCSRKGVYRWN